MFFLHDDKTLTTIFNGYLEDILYSATIVGKKLDIPL